MYDYLGMDDYQLKQSRDSKQALQRALAMNIPRQASRRSQNASWLN